MATSDTSSLTVSTTEAKVTRSFNATPEQVFDGWVKQEIAKYWLFTNDNSNMETRKTEVDGRVGGSYKVVDHCNDMELTATGEFLEIDRPNRLVLTFKMEQFGPGTDTLTVEIAPQEKGSQMTLTQVIHVPHETNQDPNITKQILAAYASETEKGWVKMFDRLAAQLEK